MRKFVSFDNELVMTNHFPGDLEQSDLFHGWVIQDQENVFVVLVMSTQGGNTYWNVTYSQIDGPIEVRQGNIDGPTWSVGVARFKMLAAQLEEAINGAFDDLTGKWIDRYLP